MLIECALVCSSGVIVTEGLQDIRQAVVGQVGGAQGGWRDGVQGGWRLLSSGPHTIKPMVSSRQDVGKLDEHDPFQTQPLMVAVNREMGVQDGEQVQTLHMGEQQRHVININAFCVDGRVRFHPASLPDSPNPIQK